MCFTKNLYFSLICLWDKYILANYTVWVFYVYVSLCSPAIVFPCYTQKSLKLFGAFYPPFKLTCILLLNFLFHPCPGRLATVPCVSFLIVLCSVDKGTWRSVKWRSALRLLILLHNFCSQVLRQFITRSSFCSPCLLWHETETILVSSGVAILPVHSDIKQASYAWNKIIYSQFWMFCVKLCQISQICFFLCYSNASRK